MDEIAMLILRSSRTRISGPTLHEDVWSHINSLLPLRDDAHLACLSPAFLHSWRSYPNLTLNKQVLHSEAHECEEKFCDIIDGILRNHSGLGLKILKLELGGISCFYLDNWLRVAVKPGIEELTLKPCRSNPIYNFPCSLLSDGVRNSIRYLDLGVCSFRSDP